jgi:LysM repeat protein
VRFAEPVRTWQLPKRLPTTPTLLAAGAAVLLAFLIGHVTGGGDSSVATSDTSASVTTTTTTIPPLPTTHTVARGETLSSIAGALGLTTAQLASYNGIGNLNHVFVGEVLKIPPATSPTTATPPATVAHR